MKQITFRLPAEHHGRLVRMAEDCKADVQEVVLDAVLGHLDQWDTDRLTSRNPASKGKPVGRDFESLSEMREVQERSALAIQSLSDSAPTRFSIYHAARKRGATHGEAMDEAAPDDGYRTWARDRLTIADVRAMASGGFECELCQRWNHENWTCRAGKRPRMIMPADGPNDTVHVHRSCGMFEKVDLTEGGHAGGFDRYLKV